MGASPYPPKRLAGPPEDFTVQRIPDPATVITQENSFDELVWFDTSLPNGLVHSSAIPVDGPNEFVFTFASPQSDKLRLELLDPSGKVVDLKSYQHDDVFPIGTSIFLPVATFIITNSVEGQYTLNMYLNGLSAEEAEILSDSVYPNAMITLINNDDLEMHSHFTSYLLDVGDTFGLVSKLVNLRPGASPNDLHVTKATMDILTPNGQEISVQMHTVQADSDSFEAVVPATMAGEYLVQATISGWISGSSSTATIPFTRSTEHIISVSSAGLSLPGTANIRNIDSDHVWVDINVKLANDVEPTLRSYAEVWGVDPTTGTAKSACWIGGISDLTRTATGAYVSLELNLQWLQRAGVKGPLTLKNVYVSDITTSFPVAKFDQDISVQNSESISVDLSAELIGMPITREMRVGRNPLPERNSSSTAASPSLFLLAGYCAFENPWEHHSGTFKSAEYYAAGGNFGHHAFAEKAMGFISGFTPEAFSLVGHSQGGMVSLHIYNYFFTELEKAKGGRLIQSVGTPYQGCSAAGNAAALGKIFGVGCGSNSDLTRDGAVNWLTGISNDSREAVHFYTTTYKQGNFFGDYCSLPMNVILQWPNDGTTELKYATLPGATNEGNTEQECHISQMQYEPQTDDDPRNIDLNKLAAR